MQLLKKNKTKQKHPTKLKVCRYLSRRKELTLALHITLTECYFNGVFNSRFFLKEAGITVMNSKLRSRKLPLEVQKYYVFILSTINGYRYKINFGIKILKL